MKNSEKTLTSREKTDPASYSSRVREILWGLGVRARKNLGQNFMVAPRALDRVADETAGLGAAHAVEIGPGLGFLTEALLDRGLKVTAIEKDRAYFRYLSRRFGGDSRIHLIEGDALKADFGQLTGREPSALAGNIPYQITSPLLDSFVTAGGIWRGACFTVQKEFAERMRALPGERGCGPLSLWLWLHTEARAIADFGPECFFPQPKIHSSLITLRFNQRTKDLSGEQVRWLEGAVRTAFKQRRKTLINALAAAAGGKESLSRAVERVGLRADIRPENLTGFQWLTLAKTIVISSPHDSN